MYIGMHSNNNEITYNSVTQQFYHGNIESFYTHKNYPNNKNGTIVILDSYKSTLKIINSI